MILQTWLLKRKKRARKKSHHQSIHSVPGVIPGTSTLSLPNLGSNFPHDYPPETPSYSLDLCKLLLETNPNSNMFYDFFIHRPIQELILNLLSVHGLSNNAQAVKDYMARVKGNQPSATVSGSVKSIIGNLDLTLQQRHNVMETVYRNYKAAVEYYANKAEEASKELKELDKILREAFLQQSDTFHVIRSETESSDDTKDEGQTANDQADIDESSLGAVGGAPATRKSYRMPSATQTPGQSEKSDDDKSDDDFDDSSLGVVVSAPDIATDEIRNKPDQTKAKETNQTESKTTKEEDQSDVKKEKIVPSVRRKKFRKLLSSWEIASSEGSKEALKCNSDEDPQEQLDEYNQEETITPVPEELKLQEQGYETSIGAVGGDTSEIEEEERSKKNEPDIIVPFHTSQMNIPLLRPNLLITSDISSTSLLLTTQVEQPDPSSSLQDTASQAQTNVCTQGENTGSVSGTVESTEEETDPDAALRLPRPITERQEKYPKDDKDDEPIVISPAALGGTSFRITSNIPQMPIGSPRNYQVLER